MQWRTLRQKKFQFWKRRKNQKNSNGGPWTLFEFFFDIFFLLLVLIRNFSLIWSLEGGFIGWDGTEKQKKPDWTKNNMHRRCIKMSLKKHLNWFSSLFPSLFVGPFSVEVLFVRMHERRIENKFCLFYCFHTISHVFSQFYVLFELYYLMKSMKWRWSDGRRKVDDISDVLSRAEEGERNIGWLSQIFEKSRHFPIASIRSIWQLYLMSCFRS